MPVRGGQSETLATNLLRGGVWAGVARVGGAAANILLAILLAAVCRPAALASGYSW